MPAGAVWTSAEEAALVDYLVDNRAEAGDGGRELQNPYFSAGSSSPHPFAQVGPHQDCENLQEQVQCGMFSGFLSCQMADQ
jgi:hypothetical protein